MFAGAHKRKSISHNTEDNWETQGLNPKQKGTLSNEEMRSNRRNANEGLSNGIQTGVFTGISLGNSHETHQQTRISRALAAANVQCSRMTDLVAAIQH